MTQAGPHLICLNDPDDERLKLYKNLKDKDLRGHEGRFMAEGKVVLERLFASPYCETHSVLTTEARLSRLNLSHLSKEVPVYVVAPEILEAIVGFDLHRGYLALGRLKPPPELESYLSKPRLKILALSSIANHDNMGGLFRNARAFGVDLVLMDQACCDPLYRKALRVSVGAALSVPFYRFGTDQDMVDLCQRAKIPLYGLSPRGKTPLDEQIVPERWGCLMGAEGPGLREDILAQIETVTIPMSSGFDSLNVATTSGIALYHFTREPKA